jgi:hypothetical protein
MEVPTVTRMVMGSESLNSVMGIYSGVEMVQAAGGGDGNYDVRVFVFNPTLRHPVSF